MIDVKEKCIDCVHYGICKHSDDYNEFYTRISNLANKLDGEIIAEDVAKIEFTCKFFKSNMQEVRIRNE